MLDSTILMQRELSTFPLAPNYLHKLSSAGYNTVDDLKDVSPTELSEGKYIVCLQLIVFFFFLHRLYSMFRLKNKNVSCEKAPKKIGVHLVILLDVSNYLEGRG